jgi:division protein CdvB (Snf7/Vps24/ESCRT-III family)
MLLPGHEDPIPKIQQRIDMVKKSEDRRNNRLMRLLNESKEGMTINELAKMMFWTAHINRTFFALADVAARLEYLMLCGSVSAVNYEVLFPGATVLRWRLSK